MRGERRIIFVDQQNKAVGFQSGEPELELVEKEAHGVCRVVPEADCGKGGRNHAAKRLLELFRGWEILQVGEVQSDDRISFVLPELFNLKARKIPKAVFKKRFKG